MGYDYVRLGNTVDTSRQGAIYLTSDDSAAPFIDIVDGVKSFGDWNSASVARTRLGKLTGISDVDFGGPLSGYGLYSQNVYLKGEIIVTGGNAATTSYVDSSLATAVAPLAAITYVDDAVTHIDGGSITTGTINANRIGAVNLAVLQAAVSSLSALNANLGTVTAGSIVVGSTNKLWLNDASDGTLRIGGSVKASAPFQVSAAGHLDAIDASFGTLQVDSTGAFVTAPSTFSMDYGYKFRYGATTAAGLIGRYSSASRADLYLLNNMSTLTNNIVDSNADSYVTVAGAAGSTKTSQVALQAKRNSGGVDDLVALTITNTSSSKDISFVASGNTYKVWHEGNDGFSSTLVASDSLKFNGMQTTEFPTLSAGGTFTGPVSFSNTVVKFVAITTEPQFSTINNGEIWMYMKDGGSGRRVLMLRGKGTGGGTAEAALLTTGT